MSMNGWVKPALNDRSAVVKIVEYLLI